MFFPLEVCFGYLPSTKSDIWQLASVFYDILSGIFVFSVVFGTFEGLVRKVVDCLDPLPQEWRGKYDMKKYGYYVEGKLCTQQMTITGMRIKFAECHSITYCRRMRDIYRPICFKSLFHFSTTCLYTSPRSASRR